MGKAGRYLAVGFFFFAFALFPTDAFAVLLFDFAAAVVFAPFAATRLVERTRSVCPTTTRFDLMPLSALSRVALIPYLRAMPVSDSPRRTTCTPRLASDALAPPP